MGKKSLPILLIIAVTFVLGVKFYPPQRTLIYSDSYETLIIAQRFLNHQPLDLTLGPGGMAWEPLFYNRISHAALIAMVSWLPPKLSFTTSAFVINFVAYVTTVLGMFFLAEIIFKKTGTALLAALLTAASPSLLFWKSYLVSDPLAIALLVWGIYLASIFHLRKSTTHLLTSIVLIALAITIRLEYLAALPAIYLLTKTKKTLLILPLAAMPYLAGLFFINDLPAFLSFSGILVHNWWRYLGIPIILLITFVLARFIAHRLMRHKCRQYIYLSIFILAFLASRDWSNPTAQVQYFTSWLTLEFWVITAAVGYLIVKFRWSKETVINRALLALLASFSLVYFDFYFQHVAVLLIPFTLFTVAALLSLTGKIVPQKQAAILVTFAIVYILYSLTLIKFINFPRLDFQQVEATQLAKIIVDPTAVVYTGFPQSLYYLNNTTVRYLENLTAQFSAAPLKALATGGPTYVVMNRKTQITPQANWEKVAEFEMPQETLIDAEGLPTVTVYKIL